MTPGRRFGSLNRLHALAQKNEHLRFGSHPDAIRDSIRSRSLVDRGCAAASARSVRDKLVRSRASSSAVHRPVARFVCRWRAVAPGSFATKSSDPCVYLRGLSGKVSKKVAPRTFHLHAYARERNGPHGDVILPLPCGEQKWQNLVLRGSIKLDVAARRLGLNNWIGPRSEAILYTTLK